MWNYELFYKVTEKPQGSGDLEIKKNSDHLKVKLEKLQMITSLT